MSIIRIVKLFDFYPAAQQRWRAVGTQPKILKCDLGANSAGQCGVQYREVLRYCGQTRDVTEHRILFSLAVLFILYFSIFSVVETTNN